MRGERNKSGDARIRDLFIEASELATAEEREEFLNKACEDDPSMLEKVKSLLSAHLKSNSLMELDLLSEVEEKIDGVIGSMIGHYRILEKLGEGGFGEVFRVEQTEPIQRELALKIIKPGMDSRDVIRRFESERQALARLDHPNIAYIVDAGATESGRLYFVMELARGEPITRYCDHHGLSIDKRLELFSQVCHGVQHAHQKGIIHRDLNPANIVITEQQGQPVPKIIDFGIAKSLQGHLTGKTLLTHRQFLVGTPEYMSPEQFTLSSSELDHRTDIYSLGAVLYELVSGSPPVKRETMNKAGISEIPRILGEDETEKPSTRIRTVQNITTVAEERDTTLYKLDQKLRGDLDRIIMKCLEKDRIHRYDSVNVLGQDLRAFLECRPVQATAPSLAYRARKLFRRNSQSLLSSTAALAVVTAVVAILLAIRSTSSIPPGFDEIEKSIAVLPFDHRSQNQDDLYFTDGIHDDLVGRLARIPGIKVISSRSVMEYRDTDKNLNTIAAELGVNMIVWAWVQRAGDTISIHVELIDPENNSQLWADRYDRKLTANNVFEVQSDIARSIAEVFKVVVYNTKKNNEDKFPTSSLAAMEAYYRGLERRSHGRNASVSDIREAINYFRKAVLIDPGFVDAHVSLANTLLVRGSEIGLPVDSALELAEFHINKALKSDTGNSDAYRNLALLCMQKLDYAGAEEALDRAFDLNPNDPWIYDGKAQLLARHPGNRTPQELDQEWKSLLQRADELNPTLDKLNHILALKAIVENLIDIAHRYDLAVVMNRKILALDPSNESAVRRLSRCYEILNDREAAIWWAERHLEMQERGWPGSITNPRTFRMLGDPDASERSALENLEKDPEILGGKIDSSLIYLTSLYLKRGQPLKARQLWQKAYPDLLEPDAVVTGEHVNNAAIIISILNALGEHEHANRLLAKTWDALKAKAPYGDPLLEATLHALAGDEGQVLAVVRRIVEEGDSPRGLNFLSTILGDNPEFQSLMEKADANMAAQLENLRQMEANGELEPIPDIPDKYIPIEIRFRSEGNIISRLNP